MVVYCVGVVFNLNIAGPIIKLMIVALSYSMSSRL